MLERIKKLKTPEDCEKFAKNAMNNGHPEFAEAARKRAIELRAQEYGASSIAELECLQAIYAYEEVLTKKNGRKTRATRTWQMIDRHGILPSVEKVVNREEEAAGYKALVEMDMQEFAFEAVILRHLELFSDNAIMKSKERMKKWSGD